MQRNVKGNDGVINLTGVLGSPSEILDVTDPDFFNNIEDGIYSTVKTIIDAGFETVSSCQGHNHERFSTRCVSVLLDRCEIDFWLIMVAELNITNRFKTPLEYHIVDDGRGNDVLQILIGSVYDIADTEYKQEKLNEGIRTIRKTYYGRKDRDFKHYYSASIHKNVFTTEEP